MVLFSFSLATLCDFLRLFTLLSPFLFESALAGFLYSRVSYHPSFFPIICDPNAKLRWGPYGVNGGKTATFLTGAQWGPENFTDVQDLCSVFGNRLGNFGGVCKAQFTRPLGSADVDNAITMPYLGIPDAPDLSFLFGHKFVLKWDLTKARAVLLYDPMNWKQDRGAGAKTDDINTLDSLMQGIFDTEEGGGSSGNYWAGNGAGVPWESSMSSQALGDGGEGSSSSAQYGLSTLDPLPWLHNLDMQNAQGSSNGARRRQRPAARCTNVIVGTSNGGSRRPRTCPPGGNRRQVVGPWLPNRPIPRGMFGNGRGGPGSMVGNMKGPFGG